MQNFIATVDDIKALAQQHQAAENTQTETRSTYLRCLVGTTQNELKASLQKGLPAQLRALKEVHGRFYAVVLEAVSTGDVAKGKNLHPEEQSRRALERNRRSNFARTAHAVLRAWLKTEGHDLLTLNASKVSRYQLMNETERPAINRRINPDAIRTRVEKLVSTVLEQARKLAEADPAAAREALDLVMQQIGKELIGGAAVTNDAAIAIAEHRPLRVGKGMFWPTESQVIRRQRLKAAA